MGWKAVDHIAPLLALFREKNLPVLYPYVAPKESFDLGRPLADAVRVRANGALVALGELVEIDGRLGVALTRIGAGQA